MDYGGRTMGQPIDETDTRILNLIQSHFPVEPHPYAVLAGLLSMSEEDVWERIQRLRSRRIIRRIGAVFDSSRLGFHSSLVGVKAAPSLIEEIAHKINKIPGITHHYQREGAFNLWFTLTARDLAVIDQTIQEIKGWKGVDDILNLPSLRTFKIKVEFRI
ncbi:MAG: AsnC family transcriptional regulator [bacterium]